MIIHLDTFRCTWFIICTMHVYKSDSNFYCFCLLFHGTILEQSSSVDHNTQNQDLTLRIFLHQCWPLCTERCLPSFHSSTPSSSRQSDDTFSWLIVEFEQCGKMLVTHSRPIVPSQQHSAGPFPVITTLGLTSDRLPVNIICGVTLLSIFNIFQCRRLTRNSLWTLKKYQC